jgi:putative drug exporter of the RND superfamily
MFRRLGHIASRFWPVLLAGWIAALVAVQIWAPRWKDVIRDGEFRYIPERYSPDFGFFGNRQLRSRMGEAVFKESFSRDLLGSSVVIVLRREGNSQGLLPRDRAFIRDVLVDRLKKIRDTLRIPADEAGTDKPVPVITEIRTLDDPAIGELLVSEDGKATLVILELRTEFLEIRNQELLKKVEDLISRNGELRSDKLPKNERIPNGLDISVSGTAAVGRDMRQASERSASATELTTVVLVVVLLLLIYRAPLLVLIPVSTVAVSVTIALNVLAYMASQGWIELFNGVKIYVQVVMYGAGVDYCMFLMARYKEELDAGASFDEAIQASVSKVGAALAASAGTTIVGLGMMIFAQFGKFQQAGVAMSFSLFVVLTAALTFTPAMLRFFGRWAFWPQVRSEHIPRTGGWVSPTSLIHRLMQSGVFRGFWQKTGRQLRRRPGTVWLASVAVMAPFAAIAVLYHNHLSFGLLSELPTTDPSVVGTRAVQQHFPAGATGPVTILLKSDRQKFRDGELAADEQGLAAIRTLTQRLEARKRELGIFDIRSLAEPLGIAPAAHRAREKWDAELESVGLPERMARNKRKSREELNYYVSDQGVDAGRVTRIDIVFKHDPFSRGMIATLDKTEDTVRELLPAELRHGTQLYFIGSTASIRDLKAVTNSDQVRIDLLVIVGVYVVLILLLRRPAISGYLIVSVFFSYLVTLGATFALFWLLDPSGFAGLDWKVPIFLFTILIAVGEDYNIYLITRIDEEQAEHGPLEGITQALTKTGGIISGCGIIMAGTFSSLLVGSLTGMHQLGFALAFGVMLDTFVVRPILVPAYLMLLYGGRFGVLGRFLGAGRFQPGSPLSRKSGRDVPPPHVPEKSASRTARDAASDELQVTKP